MTADTETVSKTGATGTDADDALAWARLGQPIYINGRFLTQHITGVQRYAHEFVLSLDKLIDDAKAAGADPKVVILTPKHGVIHHHDLKNIEVRAVGRFKGQFWEQLDLPFHSGDGILFCPGNLAPALSLWRGRKVVATVHDVGYAYLPKAYSFAFRVVYRAIIPIVLKRAAAVIAVSNAEAAMIRGYKDLAGDRMIAIQNGAFSGDEIYEVPDTALDQDPPHAMYIGAINTKKNVQGVVAAAHILKDENIRFAIVGGGGRSFTGMEWIDGKEPGDNVEFPGRLSDEEMIKLYQTSVCLVFPSFYEASPLPPMEAMACGCPVVASTIDALKERCGDAALLCDPNNPQEIAEAIRRLLKDKKLRAEIRKKGYERARDFTWTNCTRRTLAVIAKAGRGEKIA